MAIVVRNTNYNGEVLEKILVLATTGNDLVEKGLIMVIPGVEKKISLPRIKTGKMLQPKICCTLTSVTSSFLFCMTR